MPESTQERQKKAKTYTRIRHRLILWDLIIISALLLFAQGSGLSDAVTNKISQEISPEQGRLIAYLLIMNFLYHLARYPLDYYRGFILENRFGLSEQPFQRWFIDHLKQIVLSYLFTLIFLSGFFTLTTHFPHTWWIGASFFWLSLTLILHRIYPSIIMPLFYPLKPLPEGELRTRLFRLAEKLGVPIINICEWGLSRKTKKANAAVVGIGRNRRIVLGDTLLAEFTHSEIEAVMAHELAHHKMRHITQMILFGFISSAIGFFLFSQLAESFDQQFHIKILTDIRNLPLLALVFLIFSLILMPLQNGFSRKLERDADRFALRSTRLKQPFVSLLQKLAHQNLSDASPHPLVEFFLYDHPSIAKRLRLADEEQL